YFSRIFNRYFGCHFATYFNMLRMRAAARDIKLHHYPRGLSKKYGYKTSQAFSKAFTNTIGVSPRTFFKKNYVVPDMPFRDHVEGVDIELKYETVHAVSIDGSVLYTSKESMRDLADGAGLGLEMSARCSEGGDTGIWWYDSDAQLHYIYGPVDKRYDSPRIPENAEREDAYHMLARGVDKIRVDLDGGYYAVFSTARKADGKEAAADFRVMTRYALDEWLPENGKITDQTLCTYEYFDEEKEYLFLPIVFGSSSHTSAVPEEWGVASWTRLIDEKITEPITAKSIAEQVYYSEKNFNEVFSTYYGMTPHEYISKKRIYLAADELSRKNTGGAITDDDIRETAARYFFRSCEALKKAIMCEFGEDVRSLSSVPDMEMTDLNEYYEHYNGDLRITYHNMEPLSVTLMENPGSAGVSAYDIPDIIAYWFSHDSADIGKASPKSVNIRKADKVFIWDDKPTVENGENVYGYMIGNVCAKHDATQGQDAPAQGQTAAAHGNSAAAHIDGGRYAVFQTYDDDDTGAIAETCRKMSRLAFGGWVHEFRYRVDFQRYTFIRLTKGKMRFYVPILK
ncbi:MAG: helix-turn-helix domain-containing protein, partial [Anaerovoracaceae bacterium]